MDQPKGEKPALTVVIQSWWTPAVAVLMLVVGLLAGYFGYQLLNKSSASDGTVAAVATLVPTLPAEQATVPTTTVDPTLAAIDSYEKLSEYLVSNTTQFKGDPNAKVTLIEFSDYQ
jgi:hypothetical protein